MEIFSLHHLQDVPQQVFRSPDENQSLRHQRLRFDLQIPEVLQPLPFLVPINIHEDGLDSSCVFVQLLFANALDLDEAV